MKPRHSTERGYFLPFLLPFENNDGTAITALDQARMMLDKVAELHASHPDAKMGITYPARSDQTQEITKAYAAGKWEAKISSKNQAAVMQAVDELLKTPTYSPLQTVFYILPITIYFIRSFGNQDHHDLIHIENFMRDGGIALGWQNDAANRTEYALGGGGYIKDRPYLLKQNPLVQSTLNQFAIHYPPDRKARKMLQSDNNKYYYDFFSNQFNPTPPKQKEKKSSMDVFIDNEDTQPLVEKNKTPLDINYNNNHAVDWKEEYKRAANYPAKCKLRQEIQHQTLDYLVQSNQAFPPVASFSEFADHYDLPPLSQEEKQNIPSISVKAEDCLEAAEKLAGELKEEVCVLNMANQFTPGGGFRDGAGAQEEDLYRRTNLVFSLPVLYPPKNQKNMEAGGFGEFNGWYSKDITVIRDGLGDNYRFLNPKAHFKINVISSAAYNLKYSSKYLQKMKKNSPQWKNYVRDTAKKIEQQLRIAIANGQKNLILSAFGCGAFENEPEIIADIYKSMLKKYGPYFNHITFAIVPNPGQQNNNNYDIFDNVLYSPEEKIRQAIANYVNKSARSITLKADSEKLIIQGNREDMDKIYLEIQTTALKLSDSKKEIYQIEIAAHDVPDFIESLNLDMQTMNKFYAERKVENPLKEKRDYLIQYLSNMQVVSLKNISSPMLFACCSTKDIFVNLKELIKNEYNGENIRDLIQHPIIKNDPNLSRVDFRNFYLAERDFMLRPKKFDKK